MFGVTPRELGARLTPVEIATCGILVFGRFANAQHTETLEQSFGEAFPILQAMWSLRRAPYYIKTDIAANWKLLYHITLDDYHIVAVHPDTFGKNGYLPPDAVRYFRLGQHSAYFYGGDENEVKKMADECRRGEYRPANYRIFQFFPNLLALHVEAAMNWYVLIQQYVPVAPGRTLSRSWFFPAPFPPAEPHIGCTGCCGASWRHLCRSLCHFTSARSSAKTMACASRFRRLRIKSKAFPILGRHEERIAWFEEIYAKIMAEAPAEHADAGATPPSDLVRNREAGASQEPTAKPVRQQSM